MAKLPGFMKGVVKPKDTDAFQTKMPGPYAHAPEVDDEDNFYDDHLIEIPDIRQNDNYSCGACATMSVAKYYGVGPATIDEFKKLLGTNVKKSTDPLKIIEVLEGFGLQVTALEDMTIEDLCYFHKLGVPVICPIQEYGIPSKEASYLYGHYVVSIGVGFGYVFVQDPSIDNVLSGQGSDNADGRMMIRCDKFCDVWHDEDLYEKVYKNYGIAVFVQEKE